MVHEIETLTMHVDVTYYEGGDTVEPFYDEKTHSIQYSKLRHIATLIRDILQCVLGCEYKSIRVGVIPGDYSI